MNNLVKILDIYGQDYYVCSKCLGRLFAILGSGLTNKMRGESLLLASTLELHRKILSKEQDISNEGLEGIKILAEKANYIIAQNILRNKGIKFQQFDDSKKCYLCLGIFDNLNQYASKAMVESQEIEFDNFLVGCSCDFIINKEDKFKSEFNLTYSESFKNHFNREVGKLIEKGITRPVEFKNPEILFIFNLSYEKFNLSLQINPLFIYGRYRKFERGIPQTHWFCRNCRGQGCKECNGTGKQYPTSVEEKISDLFVKYSKASDSKFHGAGREDIDARMLGSGRPFVLQLIQPKIRKLDLRKLEKKVNKKNKKKVEIFNLEFSTRRKMINLKAGAEFSKKIYQAFVEFDKDINQLIFNEKLNELKEKLENNIILQKTPQRVLHRRADLTRKKKVFEINGSLINSKHANFTIKTIGGTYIKELINGDGGRTTPSLTEIFGFQCICKELDVLNVEY